MTRALVDVLGTLGVIMVFLLLDWIDSGTGRIIRRHGRKGGTR